MFPTSKRNSPYGDGEVYELVEQNPSFLTKQSNSSHHKDEGEQEQNENENEGEGKEGTSLRRSDESQFSAFFEDIEQCSMGSNPGDDGSGGNNKRDFHDDPIFHAILRRYHKEGISVKICSGILIFCVIIWIGAVILYSQLQPLQLIDKVKWQTSIQISGQNITLNRYDPAFNNITFENWRRGEYKSHMQPVVWLAESQYPKDNNGGGFYLTTRSKEQIVINQINSGYEKVFIENRKFAYQNNFFYIEDLVPNPAKAIDELNSVHLVKTNGLSQWRHLSFALYWLYNPMLASFQPIKPPSDSNGEKRNLPDLESLVKLHFAEFSPDGKYIVFGFEHNLYIQELETDNVFQITHDGSPAIFNGKPDWVYEEEVVATDRMIWWSPDSQNLAFAKLNDSLVHDVDINYYVKPNNQVGMLYQQPDDNQQLARESNQYPLHTAIKYPKPGTNNPLVTIHVCNIDSKNIIQIGDDETNDETIGHDYILYQGAWIDKDSFLMKQTDRTSSLVLKRLFQLSSSASTIVHAENITTAYGGWTERMKPFTVVKNGLEEANKYIDTVVVDGKNYLAMYDLPSSTSPLKVFDKYQAIGEAFYDKQENYIYFLTNNKSPMDSHLIGVGLKLGNYLEITDVKLDGYYSTQFAPNGRLVNLLYEGPGEPWQKLLSMVEIHDQIGEGEDSNDNGGNGGSGSSVKTTTEAAIKEVIDHQPLLNKVKEFSEKIETLNLPTVVYKEIKLKKEDIKISVKEIFPPNFNPKNGRKYPVVVHAYGGPGSQVLFKKFDIDFLQILSANLDSIVLLVEPRGTGGRNWEFEAFASRKIGYWEPRDIQTFTSEYLAVNKEFVDPQHVAIWGWSYGGFTTLKTLEYDAGSIFKYGIAIAPVTNWLFYDSIYTERIMKHPLENPNYKETSRINDVEKIAKAKRFLLMHGSSDDNVHIQNSMWLLDKLQTANVTNYDFEIFPDSNHNINYRNAGNMVYGKILRWLKDAFNGKLDDLN